MTEPLSPCFPDIEDADVVLVAHAIAEHGVGRPWNDFLPVNAHDLDQGDLIEYARAAVDALRSSGVAQASGMPAIPDDDADFTPDLARKIIAKYQQLLAAPSSPSADGATILKAADELHDLGFEAGWMGAIEASAKIADNNGWEATAAQIRALALSSTHRVTVGHVREFDTAEELIAAAMSRPQREAPK